MTQDEFGPLVTRWMAWWPTYKPSKADIAFLFEDLQRFEALDVATAFEALSRRSTPFFPARGEYLAILETSGEAVSDIPTIDEILQTCRRASSRFPADPRGAYQERTYHEVLYELGEHVYGWVKVVGLGEILRCDASPGSFARRDLERSWERHVAACLAGERRARSIDALEASHRLAPGRMKAIRPGDSIPGTEKGDADGR